MKRVLIVGGGPVEICQLQLELEAKPDLIIAADQGGAYFTSLERLPDYLLGDFDSIPEDLLARFEADGVIIQKYPTAKDQTDMELAVDLALNQAACKINILGGIGRRIDHTLGNIGLLYKCLLQGIEAHLLDPDHDIQLIWETTVINNHPGWGVSLIPLTDKVTAVTTSGLVYPLMKEDLYLQNTRGIHNEFCETSASIELSQGILLVICFRER